MLPLRSVTFFLAFAIAAGANAETLSFQTKLEGSKEKIPNQVAATGTATVDLDTVAKTVHYNVVYDKLTSAPIKVHLHGPAEPGTTKPAVIIERTDNPTSPTSGTATLTDQQISDLKAGKLYVNVHTTQYPDGEIRGWLTGDK